MKIIFYDGHCPMCHAWVKRIIRMDRRKVFRFASLEGKVAKEKLGVIFPAFQEEDTLVYLDGDKVYIRSEAVLRIARDLGFPYTFGQMGWILPQIFRDGVYAWIAKNRYKYGDRYNLCPMPDPENRDLFLKD